MLCVRNFLMKVDFLCSSSWSDFTSPLCPSFRCCSNAFHHLHWLHQDVCPVLSVPAQNPHLLPPQLHHDHALCWINEVKGKRFPCPVFANVSWLFQSKAVFSCLSAFFFLDEVFGVFTFFSPKEYPRIILFLFAGVPFPSCQFFGSLAFPSHLPFFQSKLLFPFTLSCSLLRLMFV